VTEKMFTVEDLADYLGVPVGTVRKWRYDGTGPRGVRVGRHVRFTREAVAEWIASLETAERDRAALRVGTQMTPRRTTRGTSRGTMPEHISKVTGSVDGSGGDV
jgi:excisionase family DNA binding protein